MKSGATFHWRLASPQLIVVVLAVTLLTCNRTYAAVPVSVVAAENFYGDVAQQIGGTAVTVKSILSNPSEDPHLFEASPSVARALSEARILVYNGLGYDPWMAQLIGAIGSPNRKAIVVAQLLGKTTGDNPHIWYDPRTMPKLAAALAGAFATADPTDRAGFRQRLTQFQQSMEPIRAKVAELRTRLAGTPVTATEPVFGYMLVALGASDRNRQFQLAVMNNTEPSASDVAAIENDLRSRRVHLLVYNSQTTDPLV